ncbi:MAG: class I SAM-dependent methyltransferase [Alphaproteobacteria bacterium]|nr:class I SAM-dependent methyltransferase [Alphaproteobacteria bacterium]
MIHLPPDHLASQNQPELASPGHHGALVSFQHSPNRSQKFANDNRRLRSTGYRPTNWWQRRLLAALTPLATGQLRLIFPHGESALLQGTANHLGESSPTPAPLSAQLHFHNWRPIRRLLLEGSVGFLESYGDGDWSSPDITALLRLASENRQAWSQALQGKWWVRLINRLHHGLRRNSRSGSRRNIAAHYDVGNDFYRLWLDDTMTYSAALFESPDQALADAQRAKYRALARALQLQPGQHVLEVGCGWGGFAVLAAQEFSVTVTALTISQAQYQAAQQRIVAAGLQDRVTVRLCDYRDVVGQYDAIASIEMFEAVGEAFWPVYFTKLYQLLKPGGRAGLQIITLNHADFPRYRTQVDFIQKHIFPGGMLPSLPILNQLTATAGLRPVFDRAFGQDYARTLQHWRQAFLANRGAIRAAGYDDIFLKLWEIYFCYCQAGFETGQLDVHHLVYQRPQNA